jgi:chromosome segregation ATPase
MINRIQLLADDATSQMENAEAKLATASKAVADANNKVSLLEAVKQDLQSKLDTGLATIDHIQKELSSEKNNNKALTETLNRETIVRNRLEERLQIIEPQLQVTNVRLEALQVEIGRLSLSEQTITQKASLLDSELQTTKAKLQEFQQFEKHL